MVTIDDDTGTGRGDRQLPYLPALDGLRALAVLAVLLYHADLPWMRGGFLGVEVFFVISGYLITSLLVREWTRRGAIDLAGFWVRRAHRLLPALFVLILLVVAIGLAFLPGEVPVLRGDALSAVVYLNNWHQIFSHHSYFETIGRPSLLRHLWSLAVEEQFYLLWPPLFILLMRRLRRHLTLVVVLAGAVASSIAMAVRYVPDTDPSRLYYGTDTRASGLLLGAALAVAWQRNQTLRRLTPWALDLTGGLSLCALIACFAFVSEFQAFLYRGGFAGVAIVTATLIAVAAHPDARLFPRALSSTPLRWVGVRSYGIYLWHFPIFMLTRPQLDVPIAGMPLLFVRLALTAAIAALSYRFVEMPIRAGALGCCWTALQAARGAERRRWQLRWATLLLPILLGSTIVGFRLMTAQPPAPPDSLVTTPMRAGKQADVLTFPSLSGQDVQVGTPPQTFGVQGPPGERALPERVVITAIGDSVMLGASQELSRALGPNTVIDAEQGRQPGKTPAIIRCLRETGRLGDTVVLHLGDNGVFSTGAFEKTLAELKDAQRVVILTVKVPRRWEAPNNALLIAAVERYPNAVLVDWHGVSENRPEWFWNDGLHLRPAGTRAYADMIAQAVGTRYTLAQVSRPPPAD